MFILCFLSQARPPQPRFTATLSEIRAAFRRNLMAAVHVVSMEIATLKGCREAFCFIKWLQGMNKAHVGVWHEGCSIAVWFIHRASRWRGIFFFLNGDKLLGTRLLCIPSQESVWLSLPPNAAILDKFMKKQMAATGALPAVLGLCAAFGWKKTRRSVWNPARSSVPVNNSFVFLVEWKESNCFCSAALHLFSCYLYCGRERRSEDGSEEKRKQPVTKSLLIVNWC